MTADQACFPSFVDYPPHPHSHTNPHRSHSNLNPNSNPQHDSDLLLDKLSPHSQDSSSITSSSSSSSSAASISSMSTTSSLTQPSPNMSTRSSPYSTSVSSTTVTSPVEDSESDEGEGETYPTTQPQHQQMLPQQAQNMRVSSATTARGAEARVEGAGGGRGGARRRTASSGSAASTESGNAGGTPAAVVGAVRRSRVYVRRSIDREKHSLNECRRRQELRDKFAEMQEVAHCVYKDRMNILQTAIQRIRDQDKSIITLRQEMNSLRNRLARATGTTNTNTNQATSNYKRTEASALVKTEQVTVKLEANNRAIAPAISLESMKPIDVTGSPKTVNVASVLAPPPPGSAASSAGDFSALSHYVVLSDLPCACVSLNGSILDVNPSFISALQLSSRHKALQINLFHLLHPYSRTQVQQMADLLISKTRTSVEADLFIQDESQNHSSPSSLSNSSQTNHPPSGCFPLHCSMTAIWSNGRVICLFLVLVPKTPLVALSSTVPSAHTTGLMMSEAGGQQQQQQQLKSLLDQVGSLCQPPNTAISSYDASSIPPRRSSISGAYYSQSQHSQPHSQSTPAPHYSPTSMSYPEAHYQQTQFYSGGGVPQYPPMTQLYSNPPFTSLTPAAPVHHYSTPYDHSSHSSHSLHHTNHAHSTYSHPSAPSSLNPSHPSNVNMRSLPPSASTSSSVLDPHLSSSLELGIGSFDESCSTSFFHPTDPHLSHGMNSGSHANPAFLS